MSSALAEGHSLASDDDSRTPTAAANRITRLLRLPLRTVRLPALALVLLIAALLVAFTALALRSPASAFLPEDALHLEGTGAAPNAGGIVLRDGEELVLFADGLDQLTSGNRYDAWSVSNDSATWLGSLTMLDSGKARLVARGEELPEAVIVSIESTGSTQSPQGPHVLSSSDREP